MTEFLAGAHSGSVNARPWCQVSGCPNLATTFLPVAPAGIPSLTQVAHAPIRACCRSHQELVSNRYATALDWALLKEHDEDGSLMCEVIEQICDRLQQMNTAWTRSLSETLECLPGFR